MTYRLSFPYNAAEHRAREAGLTVVAVCHADLPAGASRRDHYGSYLTARTAYIGTDPAAMPRDCAYGRCIQTIHQLVEPGVAEALRDIAEQLQLVASFGSRAALETYYADCLRPGDRGAAVMRDQLALQWRDAQNTAHRARKVLPPELVEWLLTVPV
jgi:hypothetical protein